MRVQLVLVAGWLVATPLAGQIAAPAGVSVHPTPAQASGSPASGLDSTGPLLTLSSALQLAHNNNPTFLQSVAARRAASANVRAAYGGLFPQFNAQLNFGYQQGGPVVVSGGFLGASSDALSSQYGLNLTYLLSAQTILAPAVQNANLKAADADVAGAAASLQGSVAQQYVTVLEAAARPRCRTRWSPTRGRKRSSRRRESP